jgi:TonB family protein
MKLALPLSISLLAMSAHAQSGIDAQCPNAEAALNSITFPLDLPAATKTGEAVVEFTIGANGAITDATAAASTDPAFAVAAVAVVKKLSCTPRPAPERYALPISFARPTTLSASMCSNYPLVLQGLQFPSSLVRNGVRRGDLVLEFTLQPSGRASDFVVLRASSRELAAGAIRALEDLDCGSSPRPRQVRVPLSFKVE